MIGQPRFWQKRFGLALLLLPLCLLWWIGGRVRAWRTTSYKSSLPVICIGNLTVGGTGKTPTAIMIAGCLRAAGWEPAILSRGYGGQTSGPCWVDRQTQTSADVGDEPLLLSQHASVCVSRNRDIGARFIETGQKHDVIIMDDGLQNPQLHKDIILGVFDGAVGIGNGWLMPAGPLRETFSKAIHRLDIVLFNGVDQTSLITRIPETTPIFTAHLEPNSDASDMTGQPFYAFAGIGRPKRFFDSLKSLGADVAGAVSFADHHHYSTAELLALASAAKALGAQLITTEKDWQRLPIDWQERIATLPVSLAISDGKQDALITYLTDRLTHVLSS